MNTGLMNFKTTKTWALINDQYNAEFATAMLFYHYASEADRMGLTYFSQLLQNWAKEELDHAQIIYDYLDSRESWAVTNQKALNTTNPTFGKPIEIAHQLQSYQKGVSDHMLLIAKTAMSEGDFASFYFIEHFVKDQILEEKKCIEILDAFENANDLVTTDRMLAKIDKKYHTEHAPKSTH